ncbi:MAG: ferredoxin family protein [Clostridiales bacterium]|nr:ferredoxin family protein [Clostridiales bacterium]
MSIRIDAGKCVGCGRCVEACPGNLLGVGVNGRAFIRQERDCWGCASCLKECPFGAIQYFLGADIGGRGAALLVKKENSVLRWQVTDVRRNCQEILVDSREANRY